ncbi:nipped-B-like protein B isoform X2 [Danaus plexippus]|uniref:nipped-B-like protein B isoform X2 n=1 Tax=Danaus plexippus TaxID=13037 RepID=UPI002AAF7AD8|nr:nipped-B-like protein B isoform X2 [Danaus plexippus]
MVLKCDKFRILLFMTLPISCFASHQDVAYKLRAENIHGIERGRRGQDNSGDSSSSTQPLLEDRAGTSDSEEDSGNKKLSLLTDSDDSRENKLSGNKNELKLNNEKSDAESKKLVKNDTNEEEKNSKETGKNKSGEQKRAEVEKVEIDKEKEKDKEKVKEKNLDSETSTRCTTDQIITIGDIKKLNTVENTDNEVDKTSGGDDNNDETKVVTDDQPVETDEPEKTVSKVYNGPKPAKAPDHYIDDV